MSLVELWTASRDQLEGKHVAQIIAFAGSGRLRDGGDASTEFRQFLSLVPTHVLGRYADECLTSKFEGSGLAMQDIVNQVGRRLGFHVVDGRYRGGPGHQGHDGLWHAPDSHTIVVEVKTADAYRLDLDVIAGYRRSLIRSGDISEDRSSILVVVGREDTGDLEAQIRGSRHAWEVRLISVDALLRLVRLKESTEDPRIHQQIRAILIPREYTRLDEIIDLVFAATEDALAEPSEELGHLGVEPKGAESARDRIPAAEGRVREPKFRPVAFHDACIARIQSHLGRPLVKRSRVTFSSPDGHVAVICAVSREHKTHGDGAYWFGFHPHQKEVLSEAAEGYVAFGCGSEALILLIPFADFVNWLDGLSTTEKDDRFYWHVRILNEGDGRLVLDRKRGYEPVDLTRYLLT